MNNSETIEKIKNKMKENGINQAELARRCGVTDGSVTHWLTGRNFPDVANAKKICDALNCKFEDLF